MSSLFAQFTPFDAFLLICIIVGGFFAVRNGRQTQLAKFQDGTIKAQNSRIKVLEDKIADLEKENIKQQHVFEGQIQDLKKQNTEQQYVIDTITSGLRQRGMVISVDGQLYPIADKSSTHRNRPTTHAPVVKKDDDI